MDLNKRLHNCLFINLLFDVLFVINASYLKQNDNAND